MGGEAHAGFAESRTLPSLPESSLQTASCFSDYREPNDSTRRSDQSNHSVYFFLTFQVIVANLMGWEAAP